MQVVPSNAIIFGRGDNELKRSQLVRLMAIVENVRSGCYPNCVSLAREYGVSPRTIQRDFDLLRDDWGAPLEFDRKRRGWCLTDPQWQPGVPLKLTAGEAIAILLSLQTLERLEGSGLEEAFRSLLAKLPGFLPASVSVDWDTFRRRMSLHFESLRGDPQVVGVILEQLRQAVEECRVVRMEYWTASRDETRFREVEPYHLRWYEGAWYVIGFCRWRGALRTFAIDRIRKLELREERFEPPSPDKFDPRTYFDEAWRLMRGQERYKVAVRFTPEWARFLRGRRWHPTQEVYEGEDGSLMLRFQVLGLEEISRWVLGFGNQVEVLEPPELRQWVAEEAKRMVARYEQAC